MKHYEDLAKWVPWPEGSVLVLAGKRARRVRLQVASAAPALLTITTANGDFPLAKVDGRETIQFTADGDIRLAVTEGGVPAKGVWFHTVDGDDVSLDGSAAVEYTRMWERRPRDLNLERAMRAMAENMERRMAVALEDQEKRWSKQAAEERVSDDNRGKGASGADRKPKPADPKGGANKPGGSPNAAPKGPEPKGAKGDGTADV